MIKTKNKLRLKNGFTLIELLIVIAIIGILAGVVLVSSRGGIDKANRASAITTLSSVLPEMVICQDDGYNLNAYTAGGKICNDISHSVLWPDISKTNWIITAVSAPAALNAAILNYTFTATKGVDTITCRFADSSCS